MSVVPCSTHSCHFGLPADESVKGGGAAINAYSSASNLWSSFFTRSSGLSRSTRPPSRYLAAVIASISPSHRLQMTSPGVFPSVPMTLMLSIWASRWSLTPCLFPLSQGAMYMPCLAYSSM